MKIFTRVKQQSQLITVQKSSVQTKKHTTQIKAVLIAIFAEGYVCLWHHLRPAWRTILPRNTPHCGRRKKQRGGRREPRARKKCGHSKLWNCLMHLVQTQPRTQRIKLYPVHYRPSFLRSHRIPILWWLIFGGSKRNFSIPRLYLCFWNIARKKRIRNELRIRHICWADISSRDSFFGIAIDIFANVN